MLINRRRGIGLAVLTSLVFTTAAASAGPAGAAGPIERMPLWRLQVRITAIGAPAEDPVLRFNRNTTGVRTMKPRSISAYIPARAQKYDLRLFDSPSRITMLRLGIPGSEPWCVKKVELFFNGRLAFDDLVTNADTTDDHECRIKGGTYIEYTSVRLRSDDKWTSYGSPPPLPTRLRAEDLWSIVTGVTGSTLESFPFIYWDIAVPLDIVRLTASTFRVSFGINVSPPGDNVQAKVSFRVRLFVGPEGRLRATNLGVPLCTPACQGREEPLMDRVVAHLNTALNRLTIRPVGEQDPLSFGMDALTNIAWRWGPVVKP
jgi:hypothetical protein